MIPSITNLLNDVEEDTFAYNNYHAPKVYIVAPSSPCIQPSLEVITYSSSSTCPSPMSSSSYCPSPSFPPSPIDSPRSPIFDMVSTEDDGRHLDALPPLQGCDPPLRRNNKSFLLPEAISWGAKDIQTNIAPSPLPHLASEQPFISASTGQPAFKRRRGRPRSNSVQGLCFTSRDSSSWSPVDSATFSDRNAGTGGGGGGGNLTFLAPTTWDVPATRARPKSAAEVATAVVEFEEEEELRAPRKKRGRKPKMQLQGHSCFVLPSSLQQKLKKA